MLDQVRCLDQSPLAGYISTVTPEEMEALERALRIAFDLI
jgi:mRNA-degrading endonuclease toxin of MazEF toxin-antitoxin module